MKRDLILISIALVLWGIGEGMFYFFQPLYLEQLGANPVQIGSILGGVGIAMAIAHLPAGHLADRFGRKPLLLAAWLLGILSTGIMALSTTLPWFVLGAVTYGLTAFVSGPLNSYITADRGQWSVGRVITLISAMYNMGAILGPAIGGWVGSRLSLRHSFFFATAIFIVSALVIWMIRPQPVEPVTDSLQKRSVDLIQDRRYLRFLAIVGVVMFAITLPIPLTVNFLQNERSVNITQIGLLLSGRSIGVVLLNLTLGQINARYSFLMTQVGVGLFSFIIWQASGWSANYFPWYFIGYMLMGSYQTARAMAFAQCRALIKASNMGIAYGSVEMVIAISYLLASPLAGLIYTVNPEQIYLDSLALIGIALIISVFFIPIKAVEII